MRGANDRLRAILAEAGWTGGEMARAVNAVATEAGLRLTYGRASVAQWLSGTYPRLPAPQFIAEALSRRLGRTVTTTEIGFASSKATQDQARWSPSDAGSQLTALAAIAGATRGDVRKQCVYCRAALQVPHWTEITANRRCGSRGGWSSRRLGSAEVTAATTMLRLFAEAEGAFGAGQMRPVLADYLATTIVPWLRARPATEETRQLLLSTATQLSYLCGFMCFDDELHGAAQRYFRTALLLAAEADDAIGYAITLRTMSVQARALGHHHQALHLIEAAVSTASIKASQLTQAFLLGQFAVANAAIGDRRKAVTSFRTTERHLERATGAPTVVGAYHSGSLAHQRASVLACLGDRSGAIGALKESIRHRPPTEYRSRAITLARLAELQLQQGNLDEATVTWNSFLDVYPLVRSERVNTALTVLRARLRPHQKTPMVEALLLRASAI